MLTGRQSAFTICAFLSINDVQVRAISVNGLLNIKLVNDNHEKFEPSWEEPLIALEKEPQGDLLEGLYHRQLVKSTLRQNALAL